MSKIQWKCYFDEAGYTGENLDDLSQSNLFLAAIAIPPEIAREFWRRAERAWEIGSRSLGVPLNELELKGHDIYTGRGRFSGLTGSIRVEILEAIFNTLVDLRVPIFGKGYPSMSGGDTNYLLHSGLMCSFIFVTISISYYHRFTPVCGSILRVMKMHL